MTSRTGHGAHLTIAAIALLLAACGGSSHAGADPHGAFHQACVDHINTLRATRSLAPLARWQSAEACVDQQATADEQSGTPHGAFKSGAYTCNGGGQNECPNWGIDGITGCLDMMWAEKDQPDCAGCDACAANGPSDPGCATCDFYGTKRGQVCGHYVNMSSLRFTGAACGMSALGGWSAINFH